VNPFGYGREEFWGFNGGDTLFSVVLFFFNMHEINGTNSD
jgi:hypothetical protein